MTCFHYLSNCYLYRPPNQTGLKLCKVFSVKDGLLLKKTKKPYSSVLNSHTVPL